MASLLEPLLLPNFICGEDNELQMFLFFFFFTKRMKSFLLPIIHGTPSAHTDKQSDHSSWCSVKKDSTFFNISSCGIFSKWTAKQKLRHEVVCVKVSHKQHELCTIPDISCLFQLWTKFLTRLYSSNSLLQNIFREFLDTPLWWCRLTKEPLPTC